MGLKYSDLRAWQDWQNSRSRVRRAKARLTRAEAAPPRRFRYRRGDGAPVVLAGVDSGSPTSLAAVVAPLEHLSDVPLAIESTVDLGAALGDAWTQDPAPTATPQLLLTLGAHLPVGRGLSERHSGVRHAIVQHGLLTPLSPPAPPGADLLAWSNADAGFWAAGRPDLRTAVVGSHLLWRAGQQLSAPVSRFLEPVYLGQLHGAELSRAAMTRAAIAFCRSTPAVYRPHPAETDKASRATHQVMRRLGIEFDDAGEPLATLGRPVVSAFSTGVLEAAVRGVPAWAHFPSPPPWLRGFWKRYGMREWGGPATPAPAWVSTGAEPARAIADWIRTAL